jgi:amidase
VSTAHAFTDELSRLDAVATAERVRAGEVSPQEVVAAAVERAKAVNPDLNAVACEDYDRALEAAQRAGTNGTSGMSGTFAAVPTFIKDGTAVAGLPTRQGSAALEHAGPAKATDGIAQQIFDMGAIGLGKSTLPEFGFTASTEFPDGTATHNAWNLGRSPGGSSGGAGALVASGVVPIAHGQDGGGSIRIPAACHGLVGLKPTRGRLLPDPHAKLLPLNVVVDGVLTRTVRDTAAYYAAAELRYRNHGLKPLGDTQTPIDRPLRIGAFIDTPTGAEVDDPTRRTFERTLSILEDLGHVVEPIAAPVDDQFARDFIHYWSMLAAAVHRGGKQLYDKAFERDQLTMLTNGLSAQFRAHWSSTPGVIVRLRRSAAAWEAAMGSYDVVLSPTLAQLPPELGHLGTTLPFDVLFPRVEEWVGFTPLANATGAPAVSLPLGHDAATNLPIGMMFSGHFGDDGLLLRLALQLEAACPFPSLDPSAGTS